MDADCSVYLSLEGQIDVKEEIARQRSRQQKLLAKAETMRKRISVADYVARVPLHVQEGDRRTLEGVEQELDEISDILSNLAQ